MSFLAPKIAPLKPVIVSTGTPTTAELKDFLKQELALYGDEDEYTQAVITISGESSWNPTANNGISYGIASYLKSTWKNNCTPFGNYNDPFAQLSCFAFMWSENKQGQWDVYCNYWTNTVCEKRGLYPGFLDKEK